MHKLFYLSMGLLIGLISGHNSYGQEQKVKDHLLVYVSFDGDNESSIKVNSLEDKEAIFSPQEGNEITTSPRIYANNNVLKAIKHCSLSVINMLSIPLSINFWFRTNGINRGDTVKISSLRFGRYRFIFKEIRRNDNDPTLYTLDLYDTTAKQVINQSQIELKTSSDNWQFFTFQMDEQSQVKFSLSNTIIETRGNGLLVIANPAVTYSAPVMDAKMITVNGKLEKFNLVFLPKTGHKSLFIDDIRIYNKILSSDDMHAIAANDPYSQVYAAKYQLAYTYKSLADQYYLQASDISKNALVDVVQRDSAKHYYQEAQKAMLDSWIDTTTSDGKAMYKKLTRFEFTSSKTLDSLISELQSPANKIRSSLTVANYYDYLLLDINYHLQLIDGGYTFWGKDFTERPLFPVQEYSFFKDTYFKFNTTYQKIESLLRIQDAINDQQVQSELQAQLATHRSEIEKIKVDETQFKVGFYDQQLVNIDSKLKGIEERQKQLNRDVDRKEKQLKSLDASIMSELSNAISQSTLGVSIDVTKDLKSQLTTAGLSYLGSNSSIATNLLGSYKDVYDVAMTAREYYRQGKNIFETIKTVSSGNISVDDLLKIGDAVSNSGFVDESWTKQWKEIKNTYQDVEQQYKKGKELLQKIEMTAKDPNLKNIVDFVDWISESPYLPDSYRQEYAQFKNYREAAYTAVKNKRYDALIDIGLTIINDGSLTTEVDRIKQQIKGLKPGFILIEMVKKNDFAGIKEVLITNLLNGNLDRFLDPANKNQFLLKTIKDYLRQESLNQNDCESLIVTLLNNAPQGVLECLPYAAREDLTKLLGATSYQDLLNRLKTFSFSLYRDKIRLIHDTLFVYNEPYVLDVSKYLNVDKATIDAVVSLYRGTTRLMDSLKAKTKPLEMYKVFEKLSDTKGNKLSEQFYSFLYGQMTTGDQTEIEKQTLAFYLGDGVFKASVDSSYPGNLINNIPDLVDKNDPQEVVGENMGSLPKADNSKMMRQMAAKALDMAFPGVGTALNTVLNIADAIFTGYQIVDELRNIYSEKVRLNDEYVKLMDNYTNNQFNEQIALYDTRIANLSYEIMVEEHDNYSKAINSLVDKQKDVRARIGGYLPMMFFYAERLRYYYQRLNKAATFWYGSSNNLNSIIFSDPNNLRFAIDPDIKLFDWITNPDVTSSREDLFRLFSYWSRLYTLATDGVTSNRLKYGENVSEVSYQVLDLAQVLPDQWKDFLRWQKHPTSNFSFDLDLSAPLSSYNSFGFDSAYTSIKTLQVMPFMLGPDNRKIQNLVSITNVGLSTNESGTIEPLALRTRSSTDEFVDIDKDGQIIIPTYYIRNLKYRWDSPQSDYQPFNFEGYNLRSDWRVMVEPRSEANNIKQLYFIIFYQYTKNYNKIENAIKTEFAYKVKLPYNLLKGTDEYLNVMLPDNPNTVNSADRFESFQKRYPYLVGRVHESDLTPYIDSNGRPLIQNNDSQALISFSSAPIDLKKKKRKCFLSKIF